MVQNNFHEKILIRRRFPMQPRKLNDSLTAKPASSDRRIFRRCPWPGVAIIQLPVAESHY
jgi:hypothetical protein